MWKRCIKSRVLYICQGLFLCFYIRHIICITSRNHQNQTGEWMTSTSLLVNQRLPWLWHHREVPARESRQLPRRTNRRMGLQHFHNLLCGLVFVRKCMSICNLLGLFVFKTWWVNRTWNNRGDVLEREEKRGNEGGFWITLKMGHV